MKNANRSSVPAVASAVSWFSTTIASAIAARIAGCGRRADVSSCGHVGADAERRRDERRDREPEQPRARLGRRVEPRREHREQRERPVRVVQVVGRAAVVGEEQQARARPGRRSASARARAAARPRWPARRRAARRTRPPMRARRPRSRGMRSQWWAVSIAGGTNLAERSRPWSKKESPRPISS